MYHNCSEMAHHKRNRYIFLPKLKIQYNSVLYINDRIDSNDEEDIESQKQTDENIKKYCNPIIKKEYNKLLDRYFYKDMQNIITDYLL